MASIGYPGETWDYLKERNIISSFEHGALRRSILVKNRIAFSLRLLCTCEQFLGQELTLCTEMTTYLQQTIEVLKVEHKQLFAMLDVIQAVITIIPGRDTATVGNFKICHGDCPHATLMVARSRRNNNNDTKKRERSSSSDEGCGARESTKTSDHDTRWHGDLLGGASIDIKHVLPPHQAARVAAASAEHACVNAGRTQDTAGEFEFMFGVLRDELLAFADLASREYQVSKCDANSDYLKQRPNDVIKRYRHCIPYLASFLEMLEDEWNMCPEQYQRRGRAPAS